MARPNKAGLEYFPLDVDVDDKIELIEAKHGIVGFGVLIKLYQQVYKTGYFLHITEDRILLLKKKIDVDIETINAVIHDCVKWGLFDRELFEKHDILTSTGIQKRYIEATKRRKDVELVKEYVLLKDIKSQYPEKVNVSFCTLNVCNNSQAAGVNVDNNSSPDSSTRNGSNGAVLDDVNTNSQIDEVNVCNNQEADMVDVDINQGQNINVSINSQAVGGNADINPQSKVKESKVKNNNPRPPSQKSEPDIPFEPQTPPSGIFKDLKTKLRTKQVTQDPTSKNNGKRLDEYFQGINRACDKIAALPKKQKRFDPFKWAQQQIKRSQHPGAIMESLDGLAIFWDSAHDPWPYVSDILSKKNGTFNEQDAIVYHEELKNMKNSQLEFLTQGLLQEMPT